MSTPTPDTYTAQLKLECPFCSALEVRRNVPLDRAEPTIAATVCPSCEHSYRYVVDNTFQPSYHPHIATLRESEYQAIQKG